MPEYKGVMVAFFVPRDQAEVLALDEGQAPERLHITLAYLGEIDQIENIDKLPAVLAQWAEAQDPVKGSIGGVGLFNKREEDGTQAFYASYDSPEIQPLRADLVDHLAAHGYELASEHGFTPHITLAYVSEDPGVTEVEPMEIGFEEVTLSIGDARRGYILAGHAQEVIRQQKGKWFLWSKDGTRNLGGPYDTRGEAEEREGEIQFFKHQEESEPEPATVPDPELELEQAAEDQKDGKDWHKEAGEWKKETEALASEWSGHELALMTLGIGPVHLTTEGEELAIRLIARGTGYWTRKGEFSLTFSGMKLASRLAEIGGWDMPDGLVAGDRVQYESRSELWPVRESDQDEPTGKSWDVTLIGAETPAEVVRRNGQEFVRSKNGRLYSCKALEQSAGQWNGTKVYDNHLTDEEFENRQGMRSVVKEWVGTIVKPYWDSKRRQLRGIFKVVDESLARKLLEAHNHGILATVGLSIDTLPVMSGSLHEGQPISIIDGFQKIFSVDLVAEPAAGGGFNRLMASVIENGGTTVSTNGGQLIEWIQTDPVAAKALLKELVREAFEKQRN